MWRLGFFFHEMGFGLLSVFLPLHIVSLAGGNGLFYVGAMTALALFLAIPASFLWGYLCDKTRHFKRYILISFLASGVLLYSFTLTTDVFFLVILYAVMSIIHVAHEAPKNVLIAELYSRPDWEKAFAFYEGFTETGWLIGLLLGFFASTYKLGATNTLFLCSGLNLAAFVISLIFVADPLLILERSLVNIEKTISFTYRGVSLASSLLDGASIRPRLRKENVRAFCGGLILFSLATSLLFTPMPVFISNIVQNACLPAGVVFAIFVLNSGGGVAGYILAGSRSKGSTGKTSISRIVIFRGLLSLLLIASFQLSAYNGVALVSTILVLMGFAYALFLVYTLSLSMELIPAGKAGLFNVLIGIGGTCGSFVGPLVAQTFGFFYVFAISGAAFFMAYVAFKIFT